MFLYDFNFEKPVQISNEILINNVPLDQITISIGLLQMYDARLYTVEIFSVFVFLANFSLIRKRIYCR